MIAASPTPRKPSKSFRAILYEAPGTLIKLEGTIYFCGDDGSLTEFEPEMAPWTTILGEIGIGDTQALCDHRHGGAPRIACGRAMERG